MSETFFHCPQCTKKYKTENKWKTHVTSIHGIVPPYNVPEKQPVNYQPKKVYMTECCICFTEKADAAITPCGHANYCMNCISKYPKEKGCPSCRGPIQSILKIYM